MYSSGGFERVFFFSRENFRFARDIFRKSAREFEKVPVTKNPEFCPWKLTSCPWQIAKKVPVKNEKCPWQFLKFCPWQNKKCRDKAVVFYPIFFYHQLKLPFFTSWENLIGQSFIQNPKIYFFCTKKGGKTASFLLTRKSPHAIHSKSDGVSIIV